MFFVRDIRNSTKDKTFLNYETYAMYAEKYLQPEQIDEVDITPYLMPSNA